MTAMFAQPGDPPSFLAADLTRVIRDAAANAPRSKQVHIGPSEVGTPCARKLAYKLLDWPVVPGTGGDPWASIIGTAVHNWLQKTFTDENKSLGWDRWAVEQRVMVRHGLYGSCDLYDRHTNTVIDWKVVGTTSMTEYKAHGPRPDYLVQAHLYGLGWVNAGETPERVALAFLPRSGVLDGLYVWTADYSPKVAQEALSRLDMVLGAINGLDPENHPERWGLIPDDPRGCRFCPWQNRNLTSPGADGCPGPATQDTAA